MLTKLSKKLWPIMSLAIFSIGCGKKLVDSKTQANSIERENQERPSTFIINLDATRNLSHQVQLTDHATFEIPDKLVVRSGSNQNQVVEITYNVNEFDNEDYEFKCTYTSSQLPYEMPLSSCESFDGSNYGDIQGQLFQLYKGDLIEMSFSTSPTNNLIVDAFYIMNWF